MLASLLFVCMLRQTYQDLWQDREIEVSSPTARRMALAVRKIRMHPNRDWTVASLAREVGLSRSAFAAAFRGYTGVTPLGYVTDVRMKRAAELLEHESISLGEVAERVGYAVEASFARVFKQYYGASPKSFAARRRR
jgi:AraC-like DNA-binding protein